MDREELYPPLVLGETFPFPKGTLTVKDVLRNPFLLTEEGREKLEQCIECGHGRLKQVPGTYTYRCDCHCGHEEHYPPTESEPKDFGVRSGRVGRGCVAGE